MGTLREAIANTLDLAQRASEPAAETKLEVVARKMTISGSGGQPQTGKDYDQLAKQLLAKIEAGLSLERPELKDAAWCIWNSRPKIADHPNELRVLLDQMANSGSSRLIRPLCSAYLMGYREDAAGLDQVAQTLRQMAGQAGGIYKERDNKFSIFDVRVGPQAIAAAAIKAERSTNETLQELGFSHLASKGGYAATSSIRALEIIRDDQSLTQIGRLELAKSVAMRDDSRLIFEETNKAAFANALLIPYRQELPARTVRDQTLNVVVRVIGDPRLHWERWNPMPEARMVALKWLTEQSLRQFLDIVDRVADRQMWLYRRKFWEAVYNKDLIETAWVVFDPQGEREARRAFGTNTQFGRFDDTVQQGHAALLMRIGSSVVAEWSHNGRCHIWTNAEDGPPLFNLRYRADELRASPNGNMNTPDRFSQVHMHQDTYSWQKKVAERVWRLTGVRVQQNEYRIG